MAFDAGENAVPEQIKTDIRCNGRHQIRGLL